MFPDRLSEAMESLKKKSPLIHCITNPISINDCANFVLAAGAKPIMAEHPLEVEEITSVSSALAVNIANITDARMQSIRLSLRRAAELGIPSVMDMVGINCSKLRLDYTADVLAGSRVSIIKGNMSEIKALSHIESHGRGIDAMEDSTDLDSLDKNIGIAVKTALDHSSVVLASGKIDIITDGRDVYTVENGCDMMSLVTGTGCILNVLAGTMLAVAEPLEAAAFAAVLLGISGELSDTDKGTATFKMQMLDKFGTLTESDIRKHIKLKKH